MKVRALLPVLLLILCSVSVAAQVIQPKEDPAIVQKIAQELGNFESEAVQAMSDNDRDAFKETLKAVFKFHDTPPSKLKEVIIDYDKQTDLLVAENKLKAVLRNGIQRFEIPKPVEDADISDAMIRLVNEPIHIVPESKAGFFGQYATTRNLTVGGISVLVILVALLIFFRKNLGGFFGRFRRKKGLIESQDVAKDLTGGFNQAVEDWDDILRGTKK